MYEVQVMLDKTGANADSNANLMGTLTAMFDNVRCCLETLHCASTL